MEHVEIKCLTLWQPWASAIAMGHKVIETRTWGTDYRGLLGIHAGKTWDREAAAFLPRDVVNTAGIRGSIIAIATLAAVVKIKTFDQWETFQPLHRCPLEWFQPGKRAWCLKDIKRIRPIQTKGAMGLWGWTGEVEYVE